MTYVQQAEKIKASFEPANKRLLREDGSPVFSPSEHAEQAAQVRSTWRKVEALKAEIAEDIESAPSTKAGTPRPCPVIPQGPPALRAPPARHGLRGRTEPVPGAGRYAAVGKRPKRQDVVQVVPGMLPSRLRQDDGRGNLDRVEGDARRALEAAVQEQQSPTILGATRSSASRRTSRSCNRTSRTSATRTWTCVCTGTPRAGWVDGKGTFIHKAFFSRSGTTDTEGAFKMSTILYGEQASA
jgi:hypothetical protein